MVISDGKSKFTTQLIESGPRLPWLPCLEVLE